MKKGFIVLLLLTFVSIESRAYIVCYTFYGSMQCFCSAGKACDYFIKNGCNSCPSSDNMSAHGDCCCMSFLKLPVTGLENFNWEINDDGLIKVSSPKGEVHNLLDVGKWSIYNIIQKMINYAEWLLTGKSTLKGENLYQVFYEADTQLFIVKRYDLGLLVEKESLEDALIDYAKIKLATK